MAKSPLVSVIIPVFNRAATLQRALSSVSSQTMKDLDVIVVDDGSTDESGKEARAVADIPVSVVRHDRPKGPAAARNAGIREATGTYVAFLDSDDEWFPEKLATQIGFLSEAAARDVSCTSYLVRSRDGRDRLVGGEGIVPNMLWGCTLGPGSTLVARRACFFEVGLFDETLLRLEDWDWMLRCSRHYQIYVLPRPLVRVFVSPGSANPELVRSALVHIKDSRARYGLNWKTPIDLLKFNSTVFLEEAAVHYRAGQIVRAIAYLAVCFVVYPFRNRQFFLRMYELSLQLFRRGLR